MVAPVLFTVEFRRKMASLDQADRLAWLASLADIVAKRVREGAAAPYPPELAEVARACRLPLVDALDKQLGPFDRRFLDAVLDVPRERFVRLGDIAHSADDAPMPLDDEGLATVSAPHAYGLSFRLLGLTEGDRLVELGSGTGYGAALAASIVGPKGHVTTFEIDPELARAAQRTLSGQRNVTVIEGDAIGSAAAWGGAKKVVATFALDAIPSAWLEALPEGGSRSRPWARPAPTSTSCSPRKRSGAVVQSDHVAVRYVKNRSRL